MDTLKIRADKKKEPITANFYPDDLDALANIAKKYECKPASLIAQVMEHFIKLEKDKERENNAA